MTKATVSELLTKLTPGTVVGHANRQLADWEGVVTANRNSQHYTLRYGCDVRVAWHKGMDGEGKPLADSKPGFIEAAALTLKGECPDCARPAHYLFAGNGFDRGEGWHHNSRVDADTCWCGKAAYEAGRTPGSPVPSKAKA